MNQNEDSAPKLIMLVDDSDEDIYLFKHAAKKTRADIKMSTHSDSAALLEALTTEPQDSEFQLPDLIFIDINMPTIGGLEFLQKIKSKESIRQIPAVMFSTSSYRKDIDFCYAQGAAGYLVKPSSNKELVNKLTIIFNYWIDTME